jgi:hypothetical protein
MMQSATQLPESPVSLETTPSEHEFSGSQDDFSVITSPFWDEQAAAKVFLPSLREKPRDALLAQERQDDLYTARHYSVGEEFFRKLSLAELSPPEDSAPILTPTKLGGPSDLAQPAGDAKEQRSNAVAVGQLFSVGTLGHPQSCGRACKYRNRKSGCLLGINCDKCHLCCWRYQRAKEAQQRKDEQATAAVAPPPEPHEVPRPRMDRMEAEALFSGRAETRPDKGQPAYVHLSASFCARAPPGLQPQPPAGHNLGSSACPTMGSVGHPSACQWPCKYNSKPRGCKHGTACVRCHLCRWTRSLEHAKQSLDHLSSAGLA